MLVRFRVICSLAALLLSACRPHGDAKELTLATQVKLAAIAPATINDTSDFLALLRSRQSVVLYPQVDGQITRILVGSGAVVKMGEPIMQIDPTHQQTLVDAEEARRPGRLATVEYWLQQVARLKILHEGGAVSLQELEHARASLHDAEAAASTLDAQVHQQQVQLNFYRVAAPVSGTIGDMLVRVGDRVTPTTKLTTIAQRGGLEAHILVPVQRAKDLRTGLQAQFLDMDGGPLEVSSVNFIAPSVNEDTQTVLVKCAVLNAQGGLRTGQLVRARLVWAERKELLIPVTAITQLNGQYFAYVAEAKDSGLVARQRVITIGGMSNDKFIVKTGLAVGNQVVIAGAQKLEDGTLIASQK